MRVIAGEYGGRRLKTPKNYDIRPTSDKVRQAIFNTLSHMQAVRGAHVLDCFCGTGALGIEAISQGARLAVFMDKNKRSLELARENVSNLNIETANFLLRDATNLKKRPDGMEPFSLIFLDPPYNKNMIDPTLKSLHQGNWLATNTVCVLEVEKNHNPISLDAYIFHNEKTYGDSAVLYYVYNQ